MRRLFAIAGAPLLLAASAGSLDVTVTGLKNTRGALIACLWNEKSGFPTCQKSPTAIKLKAAITGSSVKVTFPNVAPGSYAISVQHDEDGDGKLKTNFIGMPKEGVGVSNNPGGIPSFGKAEVRINGNAAISIQMRYL